MQAHGKTMELDLNSEPSHSELLTGQSSFGRHPSLANVFAVGPKRSRQTRSNKGDSSRFFVFCTIYVC